MSTNHDLVIVATTYPNDWRALKRLILQLLKQKLAACIQRINYVKSYYRREWSLKQEDEKLLIIKTTLAKKEQLLATLIKQHPYDTPEIICIDPDHVDPKYLTWVQTVLGENL